MDLNNPKQIESFVARQISTKAIVQDWLAQQVSKKLGNLYAQLQILSENATGFYKKSYSPHNFVGTPTVSFEEHFGLLEQPGKKNGRKEAKDQLDHNKKIISMLSFREDTDEKVGVKEISTYEGKKNITVLVRKVEGRNVKEVSGIKVLETLFPPHLSGTMMDVVEGKTSLLQVLAERFPHSVGEVLRKVEGLAPSIERELAHKYELFSKRLDRSAIEARLPVYRARFNGLPERLVEELATRLVFEEIKSDLGRVFDEYREDLAKGEFRHFEPTLTRGEAEEVKHKHFSEARA